MMDYVVQAQNKGIFSSQCMNTMKIKPLLTQINTTFNVRGGGRRERDMRTSQLGPAWPAIIAPISMQ